MTEKPSGREAWERHQGESRQAFEAFVAYRDMGSSRSLDAVGRQLSKSGALLSRWSSRWHWVERCRAWDIHLQRQRDYVATVQAAEWEARRLEMLESQWNDAKSLQARARELLAFPLVERTEQISADGRIVNVTIKPAKWSYMAVVAILRLAVEIQLATVREALPSVDADDFDVSTATVEVLEQIAGRTKGNQPSLCLASAE